MKKLVIGNWKMNPDSLSEAKRIVKSVRKVSSSLTSTDVVVCPPFPFIHLVYSKKSNAPLYAGAQDIFTEERGSYTGEVSASMLYDLKAKYVIVGHSERRAMGETDEVISKKAQAVADAGMTVVMCVGEKDHDAQGAYLNPLKEQIKASLSKLSKKYVRQIVLAYEPIWAIGAKEAMDPALVQEMTIFVRKVLADIYGQSESASIKVLYGGSVNFRNAGEIISKGGVNGLLVGRESVNSSGFAELLKVVDEIK